MIITISNSGTESFSFPSGGWDIDSHQQIVHFTKGEQLKVDWYESLFNKPFLGVIKNNICISLVHLRKTGYL